MWYCNLFCVRFRLISPGPNPGDRRIYRYPGRNRLDQLLIVLESIDQKLADNSVQIERLIEASVNTQAAINQQTGQVGELMHDTISSRVDALSRRVLANDTFRKELEKLKQDILTDVKKHYPEQEKN